MAVIRMGVAALLLVAVVVAAASVPAAASCGCSDDCYERCANGKTDPACTTMCNEACGVLGKAAAGVGTV
uniref:Acidic protein n=1 Tax=Oryza brachyantha TaxID=4533 RepID=J3L991_ORYBR